jgi:vacuolar-type H+-ATPase subunit I/STV1
MEREEEMRESARRIVHAKNWKERANEAKHAWNRNWEEARNQVDMKDGARDCFAEREDLWRQVEGMDALRETNDHLKGSLKALESMLDMTNQDAYKLCDNIRDKLFETFRQLKAENEYKETLDEKLDPNSGFVHETREAYFTNLMLSKCAGERISELQGNIRWLQTLLHDAVGVKRSTQHDYATQVESEKEDEALARAIAASDLQDV